MFCLFVERVEFDRTGQWIGMGLMGACSQADTIQDGDGSTAVLSLSTNNFGLWPKLLTLGIA